MVFSSTVVDQAWRRAGGKCECRRDTHNHNYVRCNEQLVWTYRGRDYARGCWEAHHRIAGGADSLSNCEILCCECHKSTGSYGR